MLAKIFTLFWIVPFALIAKSYLFSPIPAVSNEVFEVDSTTCDELCQKRLLEEEKIFSFISKYDKTTDEDYLKNSYQELKAILNLDEEEDFTKVKIAVLVPSSVIGRYASIVTDSVNAYLLYKQDDFALKIYDSKTEDLKSLNREIQEIMQEGFRYLIAPLTKRGAENLAKLNLPIQVFIPTINKKDVAIHGQNIIYGGVDYKNQLEKLKEHLDVPKTVVFDEPIPLSKKLTDFSYNTFNNEIRTIELKTRRTKFKELFEKEKMDLNTTVVLNTRPVMSSLILSQLTYHDVNVSKVITTQLNYTPVVLRLTQAQDLKNLYIANSINSLDDDIHEFNKIFNNDIGFNWIIYSTTIMTDIIYQRNRQDYASYSKTFDVAIIDNSLNYETKVFNVKRQKFILAPKIERDEDNITELMSIEQ